MGGYGSGGGRHACHMDEFQKLDLTDFEREWFERGRIGRVTWSRNGQVTSSIGYTLAADWIELSYAYGTAPQREDVRETINLTFTEQPFGGRRRWFVCRGCGRRCRVLIAGKYFRCRKCYGATYPCQYERIRARGLAKAERARERVGADPGISNPWPRKPKGMHWRTYRRLEKLNWEGVLAVDRALRGYLG